MWAWQRRMGNFLMTYLDLLRCETESYGRPNMLGVATRNTPGAETNVALILTTGGTMSTWGS